MSGLDFCSSILLKHLRVQISNVHQEQISVNSLIIGISGDWDKRQAKSRYQI